MTGWGIVAATAFAVAAASALTASAKIIDLKPTAGPTAKLDLSSITAIEGDEHMRIAEAVYTFNSADSKEFGFNHLYIQAVYDCKTRVIVVASAVSLGTSGKKPVAKREPGLSQQELKAPRGSATALIIDAVCAPPRETLPKRSLNLTPKRDV